MTAENKSLNKSLFGEAKMFGIGYASGYIAAKSENWLGYQGHFIAGIVAAPWLIGKMVEIYDAAVNHVRRKKVEKAEFNAQIAETANRVSLANTSIGMRNDTYTATVDLVKAGDAYLQNIDNVSVRGARKIVPTSDDSTSPPAADPYTLPDHVSLHRYLGSGCSYKRIFLGIDELGNKVFIDFTQTPHAGIGGRSDTGKTFLALSIVAQLSADKVNRPIISLCDPTAKSFVFAGMNPATEPRECNQAIQNFIAEETRRAKLMKKAGAINYEDHRNITGEALRPYFLVYEELLSVLVRGGETAAELLSIVSTARSRNMHIIAVSQDFKADKISTSFTGQLHAKFHFKHSASIIRTFIQGLDSDLLKRQWRQGECIFEGIGFEYGNLLKCGYAEDLRSLFETSPVFDKSLFIDNRLPEPKQTEAPISVTNWPVSKTTFESATTAPRQIIKPDIKAVKRTIFRLLQSGITDSRKIKTQTMSKYNFLADDDYKAAYNEVFSYHVSLLAKCHRGKDNMTRLTAKDVYKVKAPNSRQLKQIKAILSA